MVGQQSRRAFDTRWLLGFGFVILAYALWLMSSWTLGVSIERVRFAMILSGLGTVLIFPIMSKAALACVEKNRMGYAASLYGMMRNTGGAIGIALVSNMLNSREQIHQAYLSEHFAIFSVWRLDKMTPNRRTLIV